MKNWSPDSWQTKSNQQQPDYPSQDALRKVLQQLLSFPPLVTFYEVDKLKRVLGEAARGKRFLLQGGDCAESFIDCNADAITRKMKILLQMSLVLLRGLHKPIIRVGRIAGQYAKPRSSDTEVRDMKTLPAYRGDIINQAEFSEEARIPNPNLLLKAYQHSALTLNYIRALAQGGFADLHHPEYWDLDFVEHSPMAKRYQEIATSIGDIIDFISAIPGGNNIEWQQVELFTSHEALLLCYEEAFTRKHESNGRWYNLATHYPWIGKRTIYPESGHIEYARGIANPIGLKVGPDMDQQYLQELLQILDPNNEPGKLTLIHRLGAENIRDLLPPLIETVKKSGKTVLWCCDPMHGNTKLTQVGLKTRSFEDILAELQAAFELHKKYNSYLGGVHFEMTGDNVTECIGGARGLTESDLGKAYKTLVDPRLNYEQALELAMLIAQIPQ